MMLWEIFNQSPNSDIHKLEEKCNNMSQLLEGWTHEDQLMVHKNPTILDLKKLAKNNNYHSARFVIYNDGSLMAGDSEHFTHQMIAPAIGAWEVRGYVKYIGDNAYVYRSMERYSELNKDHPLLRRFEAAGIENGNPDQSHLNQLSEDASPKRQKYRATWRGRLAEYDPNFFDVEEDKYTDDDGNVILVKDKLTPRPNLKPRLDIAPNPALVYRGMSNTEFQAIKNTGKIQSRGDYNMEGQAGLTYFTTDPESAESYANSFAPWKHKANWENPAWVIAAPRPDPSRVRKVAGTGEHEVGIEGMIPSSEIREVYRGRVVEYDPGVPEQVAPSAWLHWEKVPVRFAKITEVFAPNAGLPLVELDTDTVEENWTKKYKKSINCNSPKGFSQRAHCAARRKRQAGGQTTSKSVSETGSPNQSQVTEIEITPEQQFGQDHILQKLHLATQQKNLIDGVEIYLYDENHTRLIAAWDSKNKQLAAAVIFQHMPKLRSRLYVAKNTEVFPQYQGQRLSGKLYKYCCEVLDMTIQSDMWQSASAKSLWTKTLPALGLHPQILDTTTNRTFPPEKIDPYKNNNHRYCWVLEAHDNYPNNLSEQSLIQPYRGIYAGSSELAKIANHTSQESRMDALVETMLAQLASQGLTKVQAVAHIDERLDEDLRKWFKQKWVRFGPDGKIRGACARGKDSEGKPKCLPQSKAHALGKKGRATAAQRKRREDPNPEREGKAKNVATKESVGSTKLGDLCTIKTNFPNADFWLVRRSDRKNVGKPTKEFSPYHIGIKVTATEQLMPQYLYYMMMHLYNQGYWNSRSMGMSNLVNIRTEDVKNIQLALTEHELKESSSCPHCGGQMVNYSMLSEKQDACYYKVKSRYKVWPSAYASGALVQCRKRGAKNWGKGKTR